MSRHLLHIILLGIISFLFSPHIYSAVGTKIVYPQPDGSKVEATLIGNEAARYYLLRDGHVALPDKRGFLTYAAPTGSGISPTKIRINTGKGLGINDTRYIAKINKEETRLRASRLLKQVPNASLSPFGTPGILIIPVQFKDVKFDGPLPDFQSVADLMRNSSGSLFAPKIMTSPVVTLPRRMGYYGQDNGLVVDLKWDEAVEQAVDQALKSLSSASAATLDSDADGDIDLIVLLTAGSGQEQGANADALWSRSGSLTDNGISIHNRRLGADNFAVIPSERAAASLARTIGSALGLTDLPEALPGSDIMAPQNSDHLPEISAYSRRQLGWINPRLMRGAETVNLLPLETASDAVCFAASDSSGEMILESRLTKDGELKPIIWYTPSDSPAATRSVVFSEFPVEGLPLPSSTISSITRQGDALHFTFGGGAQLMRGTMASQPEAVSFDSFTARWLPVAGAEGYEIVIYGEPSLAPVKTIHVPGNVTEIAVDGLLPDTRYNYTVAVKGEANYSLPSEPMAVLTDFIPFERLRPELAEASDVTEDSFTASWTPVDGADSYRLSIYRKEYATPEKTVADFSGTYWLPQGWSTTSSTTSAINGYFGEKRPALRLNAPGELLVTASGSQPVTGISFWARSWRLSPTDSLIVEGLKDSRWVTIASYSHADLEQGSHIRLGHDSAVPLADGIDRIRLRADKEAPGALWIDDVEVTYGYPFTRVFVDGYDRLDIGSETTFDVTGLDPLTPYYFTVEAVAEGLTTPAAKEMAVMTGSSTRALNDVAEIAEEVILTADADGLTAVNLCERPMTLVVALANGSLISRRELHPQQSISLSLPTDAIYVARCGNAVVKFRR